MEVWTLVIVKSSFHYSQSVYNFTLFLLFFHVKITFEIGNDLQGGSKVVQIREILLLKNKHVFLCRCTHFIFLNVGFDF